MMKWEECGLFKVL